MKKLTKILAVLLCLTMLFAFTACNKEETKTTTVAEVTTQVTETTAAATTTAAETTTVTEEPVDKTVIRLSTTTSVNDSGLLPYLQPYFEKATGYKLEVTSAGTGAAIEKARKGDADCLLVHSKSQEETFIGEGYEEVRVPFMYNYFVIVGPEGDPAKVASAESASAAFKAIADSKSTFISRGDASGTHTKELAIWVAAGLLESAAKGEDGNYPVIKADWYQSIGQGMGATLNMAQEKQCYTLSDKATFLAHEDTLKILLERSDEMMNTYSMIAVSPKRYADTNYEGAQAFINWMQSDEAKKLIAAYGVDQYGEALFYNLGEEPASADVIENPVIRLSTTTSVNDSGLLPYLQPYFEKATGYKLEVTSAGTGAAIEKARLGDADCLLVHSKSQEETFIGEGYEEVRVPFMYNYFVIVGPEGDPAKVASAESASAAFKAIADSKSTFISRGDASGTHTKELSIWVAAGLLESAAKDADGNYPVIKADWYQSIGQGMGATLNMAQEKQCYTLSDKATFLAHEDTLKILLERSDEMMNTYSMIAVTPKRFKDTNYAGAQKFIEWMQSDEAKQLIAAYGVDQYGEALFYNLEK